MVAVVGRRAISLCTLKRRKRGIDRLKVRQETKMRDSMPDYARDASIRGSNWASSWVSTIALLRSLSLSASVCWGLRPLMASSPHSEIQYV